ncbi:HI0074 family nucleotidyltransferase substrate-binding subunit [Clostridium gasigenes]|uniref:HI0074 family nucleotidyltransferase substrate-binding subunit n=1 Tax=Clostridium gasigenes TaxID=94869 RepID=UPI001C0AC1E4|nr:HI0074 family nucleotidyltransferase substrate-binding subunit [Clostridium gasigenes]MBU3104530.1 nucleotidyltransferase substrate binding protein [Clostridium gasigenes]
MRNIDFKHMNLKKAYNRLVEVSNLYDGENDSIRDSLIQRFEFTYELTHRTLNEFMKYLGVTLENSFPRTIFKKAYINNLISDDLVWINLLEDRNSTSHIYNENLEDEVAKRIMNDYVAAIGELVKNWKGCYREPRGVIFSK